MEPVVQVDPERCICVIGPQIAAQYLSATEQSAGTAAALSYKGLVDYGIQRVLEAEHFASSDERLRRETLLKHAYELEPVFAANKVVESLRTHGRYEHWVTEMFSSVRSTPAVRGSNATVDHLLLLQDKGALLVYSHYDTVLDTALSCSPILLENEEAVRNWATRRTSGLLHIHGVHSLPATMKWDCVTYDTSVGDCGGGKVLKELCKTKTVLFVGFDGEHYDPFLSKFASTFCRVPTQCPILLTAANTHGNTPAFLTLRFPQKFNLEGVLVPLALSKQVVSETSALIGVTLLYTDRSTCLEAADKIKNLGTVNATHVQLTQEQFHHLSMFVSRNGLQNLWKVLFSEGSTLLHTGLVGVSVGSSIAVWVKGRPYNPHQNMASKPDPIAENRLALSRGRPDVPTLPTLNTGVSIINSMWAPIPSPSISKLPSSTRPTRPTLPSPLVCSTLKPLTQKTPELPMHVSLLSASSGHKMYAHSLRRPHQQVRRVRSEHDKLTYQDRITEQMQKAAIAHGKNGLLVHQQSAPTFIYTPEGPVAYPSDTNIAVQAISTPKPSRLMKGDGRMTEHKIEYIDQFREGKSSDVPGPRPGLRIVSVKKPQEGEPRLSRDEGGEQRKHSDVAFDEQRKKFIEEAQHWSKKLGCEMTHISRSTPPAMLTTPSSTFGAVGNHSSINQRSIPVYLPGFSMEDQEKFLRQQIQQLQQQQHLQQSAASVANPPQRSLTVSPPHAHGPGRSPRLSPLQLPTSAHSPKNSPIHPFLLGQPSAGMFTYFPTSAALQQPQQSTGGFLSPSVSASQYTAAMLNPYQATMQLLSPQGGKPVIVTDPSVLQSFQNALSDKVFYMLPDGTIAPLSATLGSPMEMNGKEGGEEHLKSPVRLQKRARSPQTENESRSIPPPKRRRSSSLPDITQLSSKGNQVIGERDRNGEVGAGKPHKGLDGLKTRAIQPPSMIQIPKDMKFNDPMLGFPTPPQGSPLTNQFAASPLVLTPNIGFQVQPMTPVTPSQEGLGLSGDELRELVEAGSQNAIPPSPEGSNLPPFPAGRGPIQLWQFLLDLLLSPDKQHLIQWTGNGYEFRIIQPEEIAKLWGGRKNKPKMNYDKLSRGLRYYYSKGIMDKVPGKKLTFKYTCDVQQYVRSLNSTQPFGPLINTGSNTNGSFKVDEICN